VEVLEGREQRMDEERQMKENKEKMKQVRMNECKVIHHYLQYTILLRTHLKIHYTTHEG
jgi:hypothetical protein